MTKTTRGLVGALVGIVAMATAGAALGREHGKGGVKLEAEVSAVSGSCPDLKLTVLGVTVTTNKETRFEKGRCGDVAVGKRVEVKGAKQADGSVLAHEIELEGAPTSK